MQQLSLQPPSLKQSILKQSLYLLLSSLLVLSGCARNASCERQLSAVPAGQPGAVQASAQCGAGSSRIVFQFSVAGKLALNRQDVTYYILLNAPDDQPDQTLDPATRGPRVNGPSLNFPPSVIQGRLPFLGLLPGDVESQWTDFYFLQGSPDGRGTVGRAIRQPDGTPEIIVRNYAESLWRRVDDATVEIQMQFTDIFQDQAKSKPKNIVVNLASSDSIDTGQGFVYDHWRSNIPFQILTAPNSTPIRDQDTNNQLIMRQIPGKVIPQLPTGVDGADVNIVSYEYRVLQF